MGKVQNKLFLNDISSHRNGFICCNISSDILQKIEKNLLINRHDFLSQSTSIQTSFSNLEQKAKKLAFSYGVSSTHIKQINRWLKLFIRKHEQFRRHFKYKYRLKKGFCNLNGLVTNELTDTDELKNGYSTPTLSLSRKSNVSHDSSSSQQHKSCSTAANVFPDVVDKCHQSTAYSSLQDWIQGRKPNSNGSPITCSSTGRTGSSADTNLSDTCEVQTTSRNDAHGDSSRPAHCNDDRYGQKENFMPTPFSSSSRPIPSLGLLFSPKVADNLPTASNCSRASISNNSPSKISAEPPPHCSRAERNVFPKRSVYSDTEPLHRLSTVQEDTLPHISTLFSKKTTLSETATSRSLMPDSKCNHINTRVRKHSLLPPSIAINAPKPKRSSSQTQHEFSEESRQGDDRPLKHFGIYNEEEMSWETSQLALKIAQNQSLVIPSQLLHDFSCTAQLKVVDHLHETNVFEIACSEHLDALFDTVQCGFIG